MNNHKKFYSKEYQDVLEIYRELHLKGTDLESPESTFDGKSLKFLNNGA